MLPTINRMNPDISGGKDQQEKTKATGGRAGSGPSFLFALLFVARLARQVG